MRFAFFVVCATATLLATTQAVKIDTAVTTIETIDNVMAQTDMESITDATTEKRKNKKKKRSMAVIKGHNGGP